MLTELRKNGLHSILKKKERPGLTKALSYGKLGCDESLGSFPGSANESSEEQAANTCLAPPGVSERPSLEKKAASTGRGLGSQGSCRRLKVKVMRGGTVEDIGTVKRIGSDRNLTLKRLESLRALGKKSISSRELGETRSKTPVRSRRTDEETPTPGRTPGRKTFSSRRLLAKQCSARSLSCRNLAPTDDTSNSKATLSLERTDSSRSLGRKALSSSRLAAKESRSRSVSRPRTSGDNTEQEEEMATDTTNSRSRSSIKQRPALERKGSSRRCLVKNRTSSGRHLQGRSKSTSRQRSKSRQIPEEGRKPSSGRWLEVDQIEQAE